ncbi:MAG: glutathione S-transferase [Gammaproteobacteria bacterium]|jgi:glutathione S-transferase
MADLRIFSYLPNPRLFKATIAARLVDVEVEIRGARPKELSEWLWDFDARPLTAADRANESYARSARAGFSGTLYKTDEFIAANPYGTVPVAFSPDGEVGIFESNSMLRAVARLARSGPALYGDGPYQASRIDAFLDASLVFARDSQRYLFGLMGQGLTDELHKGMTQAFNTYLNGIEATLANNADYLVGSDITCADICFAAEVVLFALSRTEKQRIEDAGFPLIYDEQVAVTYPRAMEHLDKLLGLPSFTPDLTSYHTDMTLAKFLS